MNFRDICRSNLVAIWIVTITAIFATCFWGSIELYGGDLPGYIIFMGLISILSFIWAVWSSVPPKE